MNTKYDCNYKRERQEGSSIIIKEVYYFVCHGNKIMRSVCVVCVCHDIYFNYINFLIN